LSIGLARLSWLRGNQILDERAVEKERFLAAHYLKSGLLQFSSQEVWRELVLLRLFISGEVTPTLNVGFNYD
jgi:hypothetical protein